MQGYCHTYYFTILMFYTSVKRCLPPWQEDPLVSHTTTGRYSCGSTVTYTCPPCFRLEGVSSATCQPDEEWDGEPPVCVPVCCPPLEVLRSEDPDYDVVTMTYNYTSARDEEQEEVCGENHVCQRVDVTCEECHEYEREGEVYSRWAFTFTFTNLSGVQQVCLHFHFH